MNDVRKSAEELVVDSLPSGALRLNRCSENACRASSQHMPKIICKGESLISDGGKACDCVFFLLEAKNLATNIGLVELKSNNFNARTIGEKFENVESVVKEVCSKAGVDITGISRYVFAKSHPPIGTAAYVIMVKKAGVRLKRCGDQI
ncbi:MAG: hypothetical protein AAF916_05405 [Planctomycetota bacterium]